ncbi:Por secretion system C-terminal sorting domain-containing protein [Catalinimonas alkaloidigena]|uniref:Por secretion system C-terminal sorting domain-containing protein n=1 Tax=Catalinimonas alkaloidigena TaxID=1075417 RepID=A0A1G9TQ69_9BACT|nr:T9SS type A sorting domain-containing protein [Catalinimonas alkaloidigena]SDM49843.1 Por secretion system C-terminal sorting domain-containing protein [Catalinimonas alkaloidigena]
MKYASLWHPTHRFHRPGGIALNCSTPPPPPPVASEDVWLEAECAQGGTQWTEVASSLASNGSIMTRQGSALYTPSDQVADRLRFQFILDQAGQYYLFGRIRAMTTNRNSFWVRINGGEWMLWEQSPTGTGYTWYPKDGGAFALAAGVNTLDIGYREPNTNLDKLYLSTQSSAPSGYGVTASNCQSSRKAGTTRPAANVASWQVYPNPVATHLNIAWEGTHTVRLYNTLGVVVGEWRMTDQAVLPVAFLPAGVYYLQSEGQPTQKLVKP